MFCLYKLSRTPKHRRHLIRVMLVSLVAHERIATTRTKALALVRMAERIVRYAKNANKGDANALRRMCKWLPDEKSRTKLMLEIAPRFQAQTSSFTRVSPLLKVRKGDCAPIHFIQYKRNPIDLYEQRAKEEAIAKGKLKDPKVYKKNLLLQELEHYRSKIQELEFKDQQQGKKEERQNPGSLAVTYLRARIRLVEHQLKLLEGKRGKRAMPFRALQALPA